MAHRYAGSRLAKKLGIRDGNAVVVLNCPEAMIEVLEPMPWDASLTTELAPKTDIVIGFFTERATLAESFDAMADAVFANRALWICWPKKDAGIDTDLTREVVEALVSETKLVDVKICSLDATWSGLQVVWRTEHR